MTQCRSQSESFLPAPFEPACMQVLLLTLAGAELDVHASPGAWRAAAHEAAAYLMGSAIRQVSLPSSGATHPQQWCYFGVPFHYSNPCKWPRPRPLAHPDGIHGGHCRMMWPSFMGRTETVCWRVLS